MLNFRLTLLVSALAILAGCTLDVDETATADVGTLQFSDVAITDADARALAGSQADAGLLSDVANEADVSAGDLFAGLLAGNNASDTAPDGITFGDQVAYGEIAAVCDAPRNGLGTLIANVGGFKIYDSNPGSTALRAHYIQGFDDKCARQFSAALILTGDVGTHEVVRYLPSNRASFNDTDNAYEAIKASFCRVRHGKPCGSRLDALSKSTTFITAYETFGSRPRWAEILLHDGDMKAIDFKSH